MLKTIFIVLFTFIMLPFRALADPVSPLPPDQAFVFSAYFNQNKQLILQWDIAPGYYLYRNQLKLTPTSLNHVNLDIIKLPEGHQKQDILHGRYEAYTGALKIPVTFFPSDKGLLSLHMGYQGCSSAGFCYAPIKKLLTVDLSHLTKPQSLNQYVHSTHETLKSSDSNQIDALTFLNAHHWPVILLSFLGLGLLLAFTPCVLPMVPILSGIIIGQGKKSNKKRAFFLSVAYVSGMAITYAIAGIVIALIGSSIQTELQKPWIIVLFSGLFVLLALSLFGLYELQLPQRFQRQITALSNKQSGGTYVGVFLMGGLSTLIVSPCVSAPLVGVLAYIGQTGNVILGAFALFALGIGMGIPLLLIGISADKLLPKAGVWMVMIEKIFGFVMLGLAIFMLSRMIPGPITLFLWAILFIVAAIFFAVFSPIPKQLRGLSIGSAVLLLVYGIILMVGAVEGNSDLLHPWAEFHKTERETFSTPSFFHVIDSMNELDRALMQAKTHNQRALLDFYADWCSSCVLMDRTVFSKQAVQNALKNTVVLRADLTKNNAFDQALLKRFSVVGPPTILFFNRQGEELTSSRIVGEVSADEFLNQITKMRKGSARAK